MTVLNSHISWCDGTMNLSVGCTKVSAACDNCYAEVLVNRLFGGNFGDIRLNGHRLKDIRKFKPVLDANGALRPKLVFVNSMSDFFHEDIPDKFVHDSLDEFERHPDVIFQVLSKRPIRAKNVILDRYKGKGVPNHIWFGFSCEDNRVKARLNVLRKIKDRVGDMTTFTSTEPIVENTDELDFTGIDWVLTGGESMQNGKRRTLEFRWLETAHELARKAGSALHFKQYGHARDNPYVQEAMRSGFKIKAAWEHVVSEGLELAPDEKGGATFRGEVIREKPPAYHQIAAELNGRNLL